MTLLILAAVVLLAWSNGANDNFKGVATLSGSGTTSYRRALAWATVTTFAGSMLALALARGLVDPFKGKGLVPDTITTQPAFLTAVSLGAALIVLLASRIGLPVSTTHALTGGLVGAGWLAAHGNVTLTKLGASFLLPLAFSLLVSVIITLLVYPLFKFIRRSSGVRSQTCACVGPAFEAVIAQPDGTLALKRSGELIQIGEKAECVERYQGRMPGIEAGVMLDAMHYLSAGAVGFARGLNDTPKIVALLIGAQAIAPNRGLALVAIVMALGGWLSARRVAETISQKITRMNPGQGFTANLVTAMLVTTASRFGLPVSTTHVSVGSLFGIGIVNGTAQRKMILTILLAWITTLPLAALPGAATCRLLQQS
jgi:PiT family inorganic phosphate transporter